MSVTLPSWHDGATKHTIVDFVTRVTTDDSPEFVPPAERIAVFDNDGTLWCEKPMYIQFDFIIRRWLEMATDDPSLRTQQPWKAAVEQDYAWFGNAITKHYRGDDSDLPAMMAGLLRAFEGATVEEFAARADAFLRSRQHPTLGRPYLGCGYAPMIELLHYLTAHGFTNYIVSGGGRDFMRPISNELYGIPPERVIGSSVELVFRDDGDGGEVLTQPQLNVLNDGPVKAASIWERTGRRPIFAAGNSNGDIAMLQFANKPPRPAFRLLVRHDDAAREFAYTDGAEEALALAADYGWTVVSMKHDWTRVFDTASASPSRS
jgi:phosphoserine phosphatase